MASTFVPTTSGHIIEVTEGVAYATEWTLPEALDRAQRLACEASEYADEAELARRTGWGDAEVFKAGALERLAMSEALLDAVRRFI